MSSKIDYIFTAALDDPFKRHAAPQQPTKTTENGMIIERHVAIPLRSKRHAFADVWRPEDESSKAAPLIAWTPYGKHNPTPIHRIYPNSGVDPSWISDSTGFEQPDPQYWTRHGYAVVVVDVPGLWLGAGRATFSSGAEEAEFFADAIAWAAARPWSGGRVGLNGVSYLAVSQWHVAALRPPGLAAVVPVEGWSDFYREVVRHGGVPCDSFFPYIARRWAVSVNETENLIEEAEAHPLFDELWESKKAKLERIEVPALVVASFADQGLHTRGTLEGFKRIGSKEKWLICHRRRKWAFYYTPEVVEKQRAFYDKFLKGRDDTQVEQWPRVLLEIGDRYYDGTWRAEVEWPLVNKQVLTPLYLNVANESLLKDAPKETSVARYHGLGSGPGATRAVFKMQFPEAVEMTGHIAARLFMKAESEDDMDVFVAIYKLDAQDNLVGQCTYAQYDDGPVCLGWLRASHRELDVTQSRPEQPILAHRRELKLDAGQIYQLDVELWPSSMVYHPGEKLCLIIQGTDIYRRRKNSEKPEVLTRHESSQVNSGYHCLYTGGEYQSRLLVPVIPPSQESKIVRHNL